MIIKQLFDYETYTYTYLLIDEESRAGVLIDPVLEQAERDLKLIAELEVTLNYVLETHCHADHITGAEKIKEATGAFYLASVHSGIETLDQTLEDEDVIEFGESSSLRVLLTPGHTNGCASYYTEGSIFTGDTLFIRGCGRTDFQQGSAETLFASVRDKIFSLSDDTVIYPGHDYKGNTSSTVLEEKKWNPRLNLELSLNDFVKIMGDLDLAYPKKIDVALPRNIKGGAEVEQ